MAIERSTAVVAQRMTLTASQQRILDEVRQAGERTYNGRARRPIEALEAVGLVDVSWDSVAHAKGSGIELTQSITVRPAPSARRTPYEYEQERAMTEQDEAVSRLKEWRDKLDGQVLEVLRLNPMPAGELSDKLGLRWVEDGAELRGSLLRLEAAGKAQVTYGQGWSKVAGASEEDAPSAQAQSGQGG
jgi:hypothetical protein